MSQKSERIFTVLKHENSKFTPLGPKRHVQNCLTWKGPFVWNIWEEEACLECAAMNCSSLEMGLSFPPQHSHRPLSWPHATSGSPWTPASLPLSVPLPWVWGQERGQNARPVTTPTNFSQPPLRRLCGRVWFPCRVKRGKKQCRHRRKTWKKLNFILPLTVAKRKKAKLAPHRDDMPKSLVCFRPLRSASSERESGCHVHLLRVQGKLPPGVGQCSSPGKKPSQAFTSSGRRPQRAGLV